ncbi:MAG: hypothetical protein PHQ04_01500 [Opitutaceae bacterium]|nr:hypothetical protein [Opitutaceae bacterium]
MKKSEAGPAAKPEEKPEENPEEQPAGKPEESKGFKFAIIGVLVGAVVILGGASIYLYKHFTKPPPPKPVATAPKPAAKGAAPTAPVTQPVPTASAPESPATAVPTTGYGQAVEKARQTVAAVKQQEVIPSNEVIKADAAAPAPTAVTIEAKAAVPAAVPPQEPPAVPIAAIPEVEAPPEASAAFKAWVNNLKIGGVSVRSGVPRVLIERTTYTQGEVVNPQLGITFEGYDEKRHMVKFKDKSGAIFERHW